PHRACRQAVAAAAGGRGPPQARAGRARLVPNRVERPRADAARRSVHDALERRVIVAVREEPEVRERVLDLRALEEAHTAVYAIRDAGREQRLLEDAGLRVRAIQHGDVAAPLPGGNRVLNPVHDELSLVPLVERRIELDRLADASVRPQ